MARGLDGVQRVDADGVPLTGSVRLGAPPATRMVSTPRSMTRRRAQGGLSETVLVPERLPGVVWQWSSAAELDGFVDLALPPDVVAIGHTVRDGLVRWSTSDDGGGGVAQLCGIDGSWVHHVTEGRHHFRASVRLRARDPLTLLVSAVSPDRRLPSLAALAAVNAHRRRDELEPTDAPGLTLETGLPDLDEGVAWARAALRAGVEDGPDGTGVRWGAPPEVARAALAASEIEAARLALLGAAPSVDDAEARALWVAWTSKPGPLLDARERLEPFLAEASPALRTRMADAAEAAGDDEWAAQLRTVVARGGGRRLPTIAAVSAAPAPPPPQVATPAVPAPNEPPDVDGLVAAIELLRSDEPEAGFALMHQALAWVRTCGAPDGAEAGAVLRLLVEGLFGVEPDAAYGRIRVAPSLPASWNTAHLGGIRLGDALVEVNMSRADHRYRFELRQRAGGAPVTWIFAPRLPGSSIQQVRVDGQEALVDSKTVGHRVEPRIQIPAERQRTVEIDVSPP